MLGFGSSGKVSRRHDYAIRKAEEGKAQLHIRTVLCLSYSLGLQSCVFERVRSLLVQQLYYLPILCCQTPLLRLELFYTSAQYSYASPTPWTKMKETHITHPRLPHALEPHRPLCPRPLDRKTDIYSPMQLVHLSPNPRHLAREIDLFAKHLSRLLARPQRIQCCVDD